ncbi:ergothioneine biosynthesis protein EgtB [Herbaspirillum huttiense F1]|uniref:Ergothioneine biosynthesis protein EgtB n=1 Tax=Herbaspirillum huttiense subsp. lycopersici TaxID=3074428 RepID=A0ABU2ER06_9BURK|nr:MULTISPECIES: ergothioneine biosynthesis protein EgtB [Herbaspirillum]MBP1316558.1 ergothioneine biosynthesis protein EgtB [Herbaspirillum sp. 1130]MDR6739907.1 ergothioneine biosynthesis protein EgtB [Herbaspirillum sp. 1173]MDR9850590.1 ergothioneine biosynthesis protein EgtB [Herbaspirillum huttiense SE1]MDT0354172.1 ergothioneine biosynthesis protein EgtB [Herbaspirillum huttiense F1]
MPSVITHDRATTHDDELAEQPMAVVAAATAATIDAVIDAAVQQVNHRPRERLGDRYRRLRRQSLLIAEPLSAEDCCVQAMPDASPIKWHLAHTTWFFETFLLERFQRGFTPFHPQFRVLFNSYYEGVGEKFPRPQRGLLTRPSLDDILAYREQVDARMLLLIDALEADPAEAGEAHPQLAGFLSLLELGMQHEQQHQELMLTDIKILLSMNPLQPAYQPLPMNLQLDDPAALELQWHRIEAGVVEIGHAGSGFCFDNETPRHRQFVEAYQCASRLVNNAEYLAFVEAGGYEDAGLWLSEGWEWKRQEGLSHPLYWRRGADGQWREFTEYGAQPLQPHAAAVHLSYYEADAYARWAGARLLTEAEWEHAAARLQGSGREFFGVAWQWTSSSYAPYPGFSAAPGAVGEYNGKFMVNQYVLRGSSSATPLNHARLTYRNFFPATARWQVSGIRLARQG